MEESITLKDFLAYYKKTMRLEPVDAGSYSPLVLAYIGDADVGSGVNIGCGVVFVNYDGRDKFRAKVGDNAFIGSNANLVAPIEVEDYGYVAAGSTITKKVLKGQLSLERAPQKNIDGWVERKGFMK